MEPGATRAVIQGFGSMGGATARFLARAGVRVVGIADVHGIVTNPDGLDVERLLLTRDATGGVDRSQLLPATPSCPATSGWPCRPRSSCLPPPRMSSTNPMTMRCTRDWSSRLPTCPSRLRPRRRWPRAGSPCRRTLWLTPRPTPGGGGLLRRYRRQRRAILRKDQRPHPRPERPDVRIRRTQRCDPAVRRFRCCCTAA